MFREFEFQGMIRNYIKILINVSITFITAHNKLITFCYWLLYGKNMTGAASKRKLRIENKKKKMAALLDIAKLNEYDRAQKNKHAAQAEQDTTVKPETEPSPKRLKTGNDIEVIIEEDQPPVIELGPSGKHKIQGDDFAELKRMLREKTKKDSLNVDINERIPMFLSDIQHLLMYSQIGPHSPYSPARWCALEKYNHLVNVNLLIVENMSLYHFTSNESYFPFLSSTFQHKLEVITPNSYKSDIVKDLSMVPLTATQMRKFQSEYGNLDVAVQKCQELFDTVKNFFPIEEEEEILSQPKNHELPSSDKFPRTQLLLSGWQMVEENFPLPIKGLAERKYAGYVLTKDKYKDVTPLSPMFAIDCEMCRTSTGELELTRVSAVDESHNVFYDTLVKPDNKIVDYLTKWSGINHKMMKNVTKKLKEVQEDLRKLLPEDAILVGQSLANDLHALKMMHPYIIDTSVIYNITGDRLRKTKLQTLAREFLSEKIQTGHQGHCSTEDSMACMKLVQLRLRKHIYFGDAVMGGIYNELRAYPDMGTGHYATSMLRQCTKVDKRANVVGIGDIGQKYKFYIDKGEEVDNKQITCSSAKTNKEVVKKLCESLKQYSLNIAHVKLQDDHTEGNYNCKVFKTVDRWIKEIYEATGETSLLAVLFGGQRQGNGVCFLQLKREVV
ncbi:hypothetical protein NQ315_001037 [Exocentrus adspersus]|uniref:Exonuclease domain-containing protein n=1 Tax=Exocentrus adspersus TaxID=1586481 RepID=A0AAV8WEW6_9CUCU|nr:hypothetical protein NQ315_001037 [Exocentrus adspersus]